MKKRKMGACGGWREHEKAFWRGQLLRWGLRMRSNPQRKRLSSNPSEQQTEGVTGSSRCSLSKGPRWAGVAGCPAYPHWARASETPAPERIRYRRSEKSPGKKWQQACEWWASPQIWRVPTMGGRYVDGGRKRGGMFHLKGADQRRVEEETSLGGGGGCGLWPSGPSDPCQGPGT